ncbi:MAG TPA: DUF309 domain-containing protein [Bacteroidota bacterium]|nr:DUF309 domain-containing protein [Bacteroidota bacterium]
MKFQPDFTILSEREKFEKGVELFNSRRFFECHDVIEEVWMEWRGSDRTFFQGIIHIAVGFYHLGNENFRGSRSQFLKGIAKLERYQPSYYGVELENFLKQTSRCLHWVMEREQGTGTAPFDESLIPTIQFVNTNN